MAGRMKRGWKIRHVFSRRIRRQDELRGQVLRLTRTCEQAYKSSNDARDLAQRAIDTIGNTKRVYLELRIGNQTLWGQTVELHDWPSQIQLGCYRANVHLPNISNHESVDLQMNFDGQWKTA